MCRDGQSLLVVVSGGDRAADSGSLKRYSDHGFALDADDVEAVGDPRVGDVGEDDAEADKRDNVGDAGGGLVGNCALNRGEDGSAGDTLGVVS